MVHRNDLRTELAAIIAFLEPAAVPVVEEHSENGTLPSFRPLAILTALADRVIPEGDTGVAAYGAGSSGSAGSATGATTEEDRVRG